MNKEAKEILQEASRVEGAIYLIDVDQIPKFIKINNKSYRRENDPKYAEKYLEALKDLINKSLVKHKSNILYILTDFGWAEAKKIKSP